MAIAIATNLVFSAFAFAGDLSQLVGKDLDQNRDLVTSVMQGRNYVVEVEKGGKIKQIVDTGANGDGTESQPTVTGASALNAPSTVSSVEIPENYQGQSAIDYMGASLPKIAANYGLTPDKLKDMLLNDETVRFDSNNRMFYVDNTAEQQANPGIQQYTANGALLTGTTTDNPPVPIASPATLANAFKLHSKPGASKTIYLDFVGYTATNTAWSRSTIVAPPYDLGGNPAVFDDNELSNITSIWNRVSEDFIPFDVDVTTEPPATDALLRTSAADSAYGTRVVITKTGTITCNCGGIAYVGVVSMVNNTGYQPAWIFQQSLANNEKYIAEAVSHEVGHTLGLIHDGQKTGSTSTAYYVGHGSGTTGWAPIMGVGYYKNITQWDHGVYPGANNQQDDIAVLASNGILPRTDAVGNTFATASSLTNIDTGITANIQTFGVIESSSDVDMYLVDTAGGVVNLTVSPATKGANLDAQLTLYKTDGTVMTSSAPATTLSAAISTTVPAGTYFLAVSGSGHALAGTDYGYPSYGSLGQYQITGSYTTANNATPPTAVLTASTLKGPASLTVSFSANNSISNGSIVGTQWSFGDGTTSTIPNPVHTYTTVGTFTPTLTVTNQYKLTNTKAVQVTTTAPPLPTLHAASVGLTVVKTSKVNARVLIKVVDAHGHAVPNARVRGTWSGAFIGTLSSKTAINGTVVQVSNAINIGKKASGAYKINSISAPGYTYNPTQNAKTLVTVTW
jgi:PKD repeat protein